MIKVTDQTKAKKINTDKIQIYTVAPKNKIQYENNSDETYIFFAIPYADIEEVILC